MNEYELFNLLNHKYPLIYDIAGEKYYIGADVCRKCTQNEIEDFNALQSEYERLCKDPAGLSGLTLKKTEKLRSFFKLVDKYRILDESDDSSSKLASMISGMSDVEKARLSEQWNRYSTIMNLCDGCFYRESEEYKEIKGKGTEK